MPKYSIKEPIQNYKIPKTDDIIAVSFLSNWLNHRRQQLYNNIADTKTYTVDKATGRPATAGHLGYLNYLRGYSPERIETNSNFYTQINNAAGAKNTNKYIGGSEGAYNPNTREIYIRDKNDIPTRIHERTHAMEASPQKAKIQQIMKNNVHDFRLNDKGDYDVRYARQDYYYDPSEIYSRLNQYRYRNNLKPGQIITKDYLNKHRKELELDDLDIIDDNTLIRLFNEVAQNNNQNSKQRYSLEDTYYG